MPWVDAIYDNAQSLEGFTKLLLVVACDYFCLHLESFSSITVFYGFFQLRFICYISINMFYFNGLVLNQKKMLACLGLVCQCKCIYPKGDFTILYLYYEQWWNLRRVDTTNLGVQAWKQCRKGRLIINVLLSKPCEHSWHGKDHVPCVFWTQLSLQYNKEGKMPLSCSFISCLAVKVLSDLTI